MMLHYFLPNSDQYLSLRVLFIIFLCLLTTEKLKPKTYSPNTRSPLMNVQLKIVCSYKSTIEFFNVCSFQY